MSNTAVRDFPGLGEPMAFAPHIVERPGTATAIASLSRNLDLGADTGPAVNLEPRVAADPVNDVKVSGLLDIPADNSTIDVIDAPHPADLSAAVTKSDPGRVEKIAKEVKRFALIDPNQSWVMIVAIVLLSSILAASLVASFTSVYAVSVSIGLPAAVQWLPVVTLDVAIVGYSWALMVFSSRAADVAVFGKGSEFKRDRTWSTRIWLTAVTLYSVVANFLHTFEHWNGNLSSPSAIMGSILSASIPLMALIATEELIRLVFIRRKRINLKGIHE